MITLRSVVMKSNIWGQNTIVIVFEIFNFVSKHFIKYLHKALPLYIIFYSYCLCLLTNSTTFFLSLYKYKHFIK